MKKGITLATLLALACLISSPFATAADKKEDKSKEASDRFHQGKKGEAKDALEKTAGKKTGDVKVPDVPKPTPVK